MACAARAPWLAGSGLGAAEHEGGAGLPVAPPAAVAGRHQVDRVAALGVQRQAPRIEAPRDRIEHFEPPVAAAREDVHRGLRSPDGAEFEAADILVAVAVEGVDARGR